jgi:hypothetical protein
MAKKKPPLAEEALDRRSEDVVEVEKHPNPFWPHRTSLKALS